MIASPNFPTAPAHPKMVAASFNATKSSITDFQPPSAFTTGSATFSTSSVAVFASLSAAASSSTTFLTSSVTFFWLSDFASHASTSVRYLSTTGSRPVPIDSCKCCTSAWNSAIFPAGEAAYAAACALIRGSSSSYMTLPFSWAKVSPSAAAFASHCAFVRSGSTIPNCLAARAFPSCSRISCLAASARGMLLARARFSA